MILPSIYLTLLSLVATGTTLNVSNYAVQKAKATIQLQQTQARLEKKGF